MREVIQYQIGSAICALAVLILFISPVRGFAAGGSGITYHGRILKADGSPLEGKSVQFKLQIRTGGPEACVVYEELQTHSMAGSGGIFALTINDGSGTRSDSTGYTIDQVFQNRLLTRPLLFGHKVMDKRGLNWSAVSDETTRRQENFS